MNYYEHHIGDYTEATAHLNFIEDAAYSRLIRKYYASEKPIPVDLKVVQRLVSARTKEEREAVVTVLEEFFILKEDGWHNHRCDKEISRYKEGDAERQQKASHEKERMRRNREERARLFAELRKFGITPKWDTPVTQLRELIKRTRNAPITRAGTEQEQTCNVPATRTGAEQERTGNAPATANQTPDTNPQSPNTNTHMCKDTHITTRAGAVCVALSAAGLSSVNSSHPDLLALLDEGVEIQEFVNAVPIARERGKGFAYVLGVVKGKRSDAQRLVSQDKLKLRQGATHDRHDVEEPA